MPPYPLIRKCPISGQTPKEEIFNILTHGLGLLLSVIGATLLILKAYTDGTHWDLASVSIYGASLILLYTASTVYHACRGIRWKKMMQRCDHICIYLLIAGSYTPLTLGPLRESWGWPLLITVWTMAVVGIVMKCCMKKRSDFFDSALYLSMGWLVVVAAKPLVTSFTMEGIAWIGMSGLFYSCGVVFYLWNSLPFNHSIWHLFVLGGSACHYHCVYAYVVG